MSLPGAQELSGYELSQRPTIRGLATAVMNTSPDELSSLRRRAVTDNSDPVEYERQRQKKKEYAKTFRDNEKHYFEQLRVRLFPDDPNTRRAECLERAVSALDELEARKARAVQHDAEIEELRTQLAHARRDACQRDDEFAQATTPPRFGASEDSEPQDILDTQDISIVWSPNQARYGPSMSPHLAGYYTFEDHSTSPSPSQLETGGSRPFPHQDCEHAGSSGLAHSVAECPCQRQASRSKLVWLFNQFTYYEQLRSVQSDGTFELVRTVILCEWKHAGTFLIAVAAVDATVYGYAQTGTAFVVEKLALRFLTISAILTALGLSIDAVFILRYLNADAESFAKRAYSERLGYFFFAIHSRVPFVALCISLIALSMFMLAVAYTAWPAVVVVLSSLVSLLLLIDYIVWFIVQLGSVIVKARTVVVEAARDVWASAKLLIVRP
ncbi:unnamed protein product [Peniophora sp. CBMAI 1063]|nr:unnamed protein product [Peniophora sp. CBMAI 1063]